MLRRSPWHSLTHNMLIANLRIDKESHDEIDNSNKINRIDLNLHPTTTQPTIALGRPMAISQEASPNNHLPRPRDLFTGPTTARRRMAGLVPGIRPNRSFSQQPLTRFFPSTDAAAQGLLDDYEDESDDNTVIDSTVAVRPSPRVPCCSPPVFMFERDSPEVMGIRTGVSHLATSQLLQDSVSRASICSASSPKLPHEQRHMDSSWEGAPAPHSPLRLITKSTTTTTSCSSSPTTPSSSRRKFVGLKEQSQKRDLILADLERKSGLLS